MIVKYLNNGVWGYLDNVRQVANKDIDCADLIRRYDQMPQPADELDINCYMDGVRCSEEVCASNKAFTMASIDLKDCEVAGFDSSHIENLLDGKRAIENYPASIVLLYLNDHKEYDSVVMITNQRMFLMNDRGQTIERLV